MLRTTVKADSGSAYIAVLVLAAIFLLALMLTVQA